ncbi:metallophosphoesterase [Waterburya agarophytonicola K14]|uniref:Metallophosphoesterase n=1 Tax=Waterburya agarophytonicola KI4 TaxID=2874699 RepID=A0A964FKL6_9CYAN|nr:metallophosphoesterase [Waterburya agarophytonicola]MCC0178843.1 metallophosphoesterase [Waterburya agarophytonicola KI4]
MKRRQLLRWGGSGLGLALSSYYLTAWGTTPKNKVAQSASFRFAALGDVGTGKAGQNAIAQVMNDYYRQEPFELVLLTGDNIYENGEISKVGATFSKPYHFLRKQKVPFYAVLGNHDVRTNNGKDQVDFSSFNMAGRYYTFTHGIVQFFALDTNENADWSQQLIWLEQTLAESTATWKVVFGHHPLYSSGIHGSSPELIAKLSPLFVRHGVQLYINGHDHNYERSKPIKGTTYLTCGAGAKTRPVGSSKWTAHSAPRLSFATIDVRPNRLEIQGIGKNGEVFDRGQVFDT